MALYTYVCSNCNETYEKLQSVKKMEEEGFTCPHCGAKIAKPKLSPFSFKFDFWHGYDPGLGQYIDTTKQREQVMREKGARRVRD